MESSVTNKTPPSGRKTRKYEDDRISQLPEEIIHQILFLLGTRDAARMAILSKRWKSVWASFPILHFDETTFPLDFDRDQTFINSKRPSKSSRFVNEGNRYLMRRELFINCVENSFRSRPPTRIQKFRLCMTDLSSGGIYLPLQVDQWIKFAGDCSVEELVLDISVCVSFLELVFSHNRSKSLYRLPKSVFAMKSISVLVLKGYKLELSSEIKLSSLKKLTLENICAEEGVIQHLISTCPLLEILGLSNCGGLKHLQFSAPRLRILKVEHQAPRIRVAVNVPNLQSFSFTGWNGWRYESCEINAGDLKTLELGKMMITDESFEGLISKWPFLENLSLLSCRGLGKLIIYSHQLKSLVLSRCPRLNEVEIDAPKLLSFKYDGHAPQFSLINTPCQLEAELRLDPFVLRSNWFSKVRRLLQCFGHVQTLTLHCGFTRSLIIPETLRKSWVPPLLGLKHLLLKTNSEPKEELMDSLLWSCPNLETLSIYLASTQETLKFRYKNPEGKEEK